MAALLIDANISWRPAATIQDLFPGSKHVNRAGLGAVPTDAAIREYALREAMHILTQDEDFMELAFVRGHPPKIIWLRKGNCTTDIA